MVGSCDVTRNDFSARFLITRMNKFSPSYDLQNCSSSASRNNPTTSDIICSAERRNFSVLWAWKFLLCAMVWWMGGQEGRQMGSALSSVCAKSLHRETEKKLYCVTIKRLQVEQWLRRHRQQEFPIEWNLLVSSSLDLCEKRVWASDSQTPTGDATNTREYEKTDKYKI